MSHKIYKMEFSLIYESYLNKVLRKNQTKEELDLCIYWLLGYDDVLLQEAINHHTTVEDFFNHAPVLNHDAIFIKGKICGIDIETIKDPVMKQIRILDKLIDNLSKGKNINQQIKKYKKII